MSFTYFNPRSLMYGGQKANFSANMELTPIFVAPKALSITGFSVVSNGTVNCNSKSNINAYLIDMARPTAQLAFINVNATSNMIANTAVQGDIVNCNVPEGMVMGIYMNYSNIGNVYGEAGSFQIDYVFGSPASEA